MKVTFDAETLGSLINAVRENPEMGKTVWKAETHWNTGFQSEALIRREGGGHTVPMDEPKLVGGTDTAPIWSRWSSAPTAAASSRAT